MGFRICSIGCGAIADTCHGPAYRRYALDNKDVVLAGCCDLDPARAEAFREKYGFAKSYTDFQTMLDSERPDVVAVLVPPAILANTVITVMGKGYPVIMEKPPGLNAEECSRIIDAARLYKVPNFVAFNRRYVPLVRKLKELLTARFSVEEINSIQYDFGRYDRKDADFATTAIHAIDASRFLVGSDYANVKFAYQQVADNDEYRNVHNIYMNCWFESGAHGSISFYPCSGVCFERLMVNVLDNSFLLQIPMWGCPGRLTHMYKGQILLDVTGEDVSDGAEMFEQSGFYYENFAFFESLRNKRFISNTENALQSVMISDCLRKKEIQYCKAYGSGGANDD